MHDLQTIASVLFETTDVVEVRAIPLSSVEVK